MSGRPPTGTPGRAARPSAAACAAAPSSTCSPASASSPRPGSRRCCATARSTRSPPGTPIWCAGSTTRSSAAWSTGSTPKGCRRGLLPGRAPAAWSWLHPVRYRDPEKVETPGQRPGGEVAEHEPVGPGREVGAQHRALLEERGERGGQPVEVPGQLVELQRLRDLGDHRAEAEQLDGERVLGRFFQHHFIQYRDGRDAAAPEDRPDPYVRVLEIRRGVAVEGEHPVEVE